ncbi:MAG TPA: type II toxin-antitoxin system VapC family toxin [Candidatus Sulfomarinibacteraceae bacterium]|nr:type II toxin-antitoxin system VapC family toxin [Candidatus Sulfomarinibacteraceae bacterium]
MSDSPFFLDVNVPMYAAGKAHRYKEPCVWILEQIASEQLSVATDTEVIQAVLYRYGALREWEAAVTVANSLLDLIPRILPVTVDDMQMAVRLFEYYAPQGVKARNTIHAAVMTNNGLSTIISTDKHFELFPEVVRVDPNDLFVQRNGSEQA